MKRGKYGEIGVAELGSRHLALLLAILGWVILAASIFLDRANDYFYLVETNSLITYQPTGFLLVTALVLLAAILFAAWRTGRAGFSGLAALLFGVCLALAILAASNLGTHPTDAGYISNEAAGGTTLSILGASLGLIGSGWAALPRLVPASRVV